MATRKKELSPGVSTKTLRRVYDAVPDYWAPARHVRDLVRGKPISEEHARVVCKVLTHQGFLVSTTSSPLLFRRRSQAHPDASFEKSKKLAEYRSGVEVSLGQYVDVTLDSSAMDAVDKERLVQSRKRRETRRKRGSRDSMQSFPLSVQLPLVPQTPPDDDKGVSVLKSDLRALLGAPMSERAKMAAFEAILADE